MAGNLSVDEFEQYLSVGNETRGVEFKRGGPRSDSHLFAKVVRAMIGMANRRDGGYVFIGVDEVANKPVPSGVSTPDLTGWNHDDVSAGVAPYVIPNINFELQTMSYDKKDFIIIYVHEFEDIPVVCRKEYQDSGSSSTGKKNTLILKVGACYIRSRTKPETVDIQTEADMRDILDLAIDKGVRRFLRRASDAGFSRPEPSNAGFNKELGDFL